MKISDTLDKMADKTERFFQRELIYADEAALKLIGDVEYHIDVNGHAGQIDWLIERIPKLRATIQSEIEKYSRTPDEKIFVRVFHCSGPYPSPQDWKPAPVPTRAVVDYGSRPPKITIYRDDDTSYELDADDSRASLVFGLRSYFDGTNEIAG